MIAEAFMTCALALPLKSREKLQAFFDLYPKKEFYMTETHQLQKGWEYTPFVWEGMHIWARDIKARNFKRNSA